MKKVYRVRYLPDYRFVVYSLNDHQHGFHKDIQIPGTAKRILKSLETKYATEGSGEAKACGK